MGRYVMVEREQIPAAWMVLILVESIPRLRSPMPAPRLLLAFHSPQLCASKQTTLGSTFSNRPHSSQGDRLPGSDVVPSDTASLSDMSSKCDKGSPEFVAIAGSQSR